MKGIIQMFKLGIKEEIVEEVVEEVVVELPPVSEELINAFLSEKKDALSVVVTADGMELTEGATGDVVVLSDDEQDALIDATRAWIEVRRQKILKLAGL